MSEFSEFKRGQRGKERMGAQVRQLQEAIIKRNGRIKELETLAEECRIHIGNRYPDDQAMQHRIDFILYPKVTK